MWHRSLSVVPSAFTSSSHYHSSPVSYCLSYSSVCWTCLNCCKTQESLFHFCLSSFFTSLHQGINQPPALIYQSHDLLLFPLSHHPSLPPYSLPVSHSSFHPSSYVKNQECLSETFCADILYAAIQPDWQALDKHSCWSQAKVISCSNRLRWSTKVFLYCSLIWKKKKKTEYSTKTVGLTHTQCLCPRVPAFECPPKDQL